VSGSNGFPAQGRSKHIEGCECARCTGFQPGNEARLVHGAQSPRQIAQRSVVEKRRLLRQIGLRQSDLESVGQALLLNWSRSAAALTLLDDYAARAGWIDEAGNPRGFARLYVSLLNAERLALRGLAEHLRAAGTDPWARLADHLAERQP
jgi:hypothetical protein